MLPPQGAVYRQDRIGEHGCMNRLDSLSIVPPAFAAADVAAAVAAQFGLRGTLAPLVSERDQNFCLAADTGARFVVKVTSALEDEAASEFQVAALVHLALQDGIQAPGVVYTTSGQRFGTISDAAMTYRLRVVTWVEGEQLETLPLDPPLAERFGAALARLNQALRGFSHPGENPVLLWDLQRVRDLRPLLEGIDDAAIRANVAAAIDDYGSHVVPAIPTLQSQVIHSDANPENVLVTTDGFGFIDFGDMLKAPRIFEAAIAASYLRSLAGEPLQLIAPFIGGYHRKAPLEADETDLLFDLIRARLATTVTLLYWRLRERPAHDEYRQKSLLLEGSASHFLAVLDRLGKQKFNLKIKGICSDR